MVLLKQRKDETALGMLTYNVHAVLKSWFKNNLILDSILRILSIILKKPKLASKILKLDYVAFLNLIGMVMEEEGGYYEQWYVSDSRRYRDPWLCTVTVL